MNLIDNLYFHQLQKSAIVKFKGQLEERLNYYRNRIYFMNCTNYNFIISMVIFSKAKDMLTYTIF